MIGAAKVKDEFSCSLPELSFEDAWSLFRELNEQMPNPKNVMGIESKDEFS